MGGAVHFLPSLILILANLGCCGFSLAYMLRPRATAPSFEDPTLSDAQAFHEGAETEEAA